MNNILFIGTYQHKVDNRGRVSIPAKWRKQLVNNELFIFKEEWTNWICYIELDDDDKQDELQCIKKYNIDSTGRIFLNPDTDNVVLTGWGDYFVIKTED